MLRVAKARLKSKVNYIWRDANFGSTLTPLQLRNFSLNSRDHAFAILELKTFSEAEIAQSFARLKHAQEIHSDPLQCPTPSEQQSPSPGSVNIHKGIEILARDEYSVSLDQKSINKVSALVTGIKVGQTVDSRGNVHTMDIVTYQKKIRELGEKLDPRVWNIGLSFLATGTSVGILIPCMPLLVSQLNIPPSEFGLVVSAFGLSKLIGNIPSGYFVEKYGRKPSMMVGLGMCGVGLGSIGLALLPGFGTPWLIACRLVSGLGVSSFVAGGYMFMSDISTPLNRTRTIAPVMAGFSGGAALGPAAGGVLIDSIGIGQTYATVGVMFLTLAAMNGLLLHETKNFTSLSNIEAPHRKNVIIDAAGASKSDNNGDINREKESEKKNSSARQTTFTQDKDNTFATKPDKPDVGVLGSFNEAFSAWKVLWNDPNKQLRHTVTMNGLFWFTLSGTQMTLLPLLMVSPTVGVDTYSAVTGGLAMSAAEIGASFAFMSLVSFVSAQPMAYLADKYGKVPTILGGCGLLSCSMAALPLTTTLEWSLPFATGMPAYTPALVAVLLPFALSTTALNATPTALVSDLTEPSNRAQALSLLRTAGDLGLLLGASCAGAVATYTSLGTALQVNGALTAGAMCWFAVKNKTLLKTFFTSRRLFRQ